MKRRRRRSMAPMQERAALERIFRAAVAACHPRQMLPGQLPPPPRGRTILLAIGKAAAAMAELAEEHWNGPLSGLAVGRHGDTATLRRIAFATAAHPVPDEASVAAAARLIALAKDAGEDALMLVLLSGGASSLACLPSAGVTLARKQDLLRSLLRSGATIGEINCVRRHLSRIKGGRLGAAAQPARMVTLAISDVVGDRPHDIGSGPTVADPTDCEEARGILAKHDLSPLPAWSESVKPAQAAAWDAEYRIIARGRDAVDAAAAEAARSGYRPQVIGHDCTGEARMLAEAHAAVVREALAGDQRVALISGGEATVTVTGPGAGGPNQEYALALAIMLDGLAGVAGLAADSDGVDGRSEAAGAFLGAGTLARARALGLDASAMLRANDSGGFFAALGDRLVTGATGTNVNDLRIILVDPQA